MYVYGPRQKQYVTTIEKKFRATICEQITSKDGADAWLLQTIDIHVY